MPEVTEYSPGAFCWADVSTPDVAAGKRFYTELFGWSAVEFSAGGGVYCNFSRDGKSVCGLHPSAEGTFPCWTSYVSVESADAAANRAVELGGWALVSPFNAMEAGRSAVLRDPTGATFAIWQPKQHIGAALVNEPGALCWNELLTRDVAAAEAFYCGLFGWTANTTPSPSGVGHYTEFKNGERSAGGMLAIQEAWGEMPASWVVYFTVENCTGAIRKAESLGGSAEFPAMEIPGIGKLVYLSDPHGAVFAVIETLAGGAA